jgi:hypothetical protein
MTIYLQCTWDARPISNPQVTPHLMFVGKKKHIYIRQNYPKNVRVLEATSIINLINQLKVHPNHHFSKRYHLVI